MDDLQALSDTPQGLLDDPHCSNEAAATVLTLPRLFARPLLTTVEYQTAVHGT